MDQSLKVINIKNEPTDLTSSDQMGISSEMQVENDKQQSNSLVQSEIYIKMEPKEDESQFIAIAETSHEICQNYDMAIETEEPLIKIEYKNLKNEILQDPLEIGDNIKVGEQFLINLEQGKPRIKIEPTEGAKNDKLLETDEDDSYGSGSNQLLHRNNANCKNKKHICHVCNKIFTQKWTLNRHLRIHTGEKPFTCDVCEKSFIEKGKLVRHMLIHSDEKTHFCDLRKKVFRHKLSFDSHKLIHGSIKLFSCDVCDQSFAHKTNLVVHKRIHAGDKPFSCDLCNEVFRHKSALTRHRRTHTGEKPYPCDICNKSFARKEHLNHHKRIHKN